jgi:hypothetical protein
VHNLPKEERRKPRQVRGRVLADSTARFKLVPVARLTRAGKILDRNEELGSRHRFLQQTGKHYSANRRKVHMPETGHSLPCIDNPSSA